MACKCCNNDNNKIMRMRIELPILIRILFSTPIETRDRIIKLLSQYMDNRNQIIVTNIDREVLVKLYDLFYGECQ